MLGSMVLANVSYVHPGIYSLDVDSPPKPLVAHLVVICRTKTGKVLKDSIAVKYVILIHL